MARKPHYRRGRRRKRGFATWSLGKKIAVILSSTLLAVLAIGTVILASKLSKIETTKLDAEKLNISEEVEHETVGEICKAVNIPAVAIGGITAENVKELKGRGLAGVAVISAIFGQPDIEEGTRTLKKAVKEMVEQVWYRE